MAEIRANAVDVGARPRIPKPVETLPPALRTRPVTGRQRRGFIPEEEFGEATGHHQLTAPSLELELADDPALKLVALANGAAVVVQAAAVAQ